MEIKMAMIYHLSSIKTVALKRIRDKCWECGEKGILTCCQWGCELLQPLWKTVWKLLRTLRIELAYYPAVPLLGFYSEEMKSVSQEMPASPCSWQHFSYRQNVEATSVSTNGWMDKDAVCLSLSLTHTHTHTHTQRRIFFSHEEEGVPAICDKIDEPWGHYAKWNKSEKRKRY